MVPAPRSPPYSPIYADVIANADVLWDGPTAQSDLLARPDGGQSILASILALFPGAVSGGDITPERSASCGACIGGGDRVWVTAVAVSFGASGSPGVSLNHTVDGMCLPESKVAGLKAGIGVPGMKDFIVSNYSGWQAVLRIEPDKFYWYKYSCERTLSQFAIFIIVLVCALCLCCIIILIIIRCCRKARDTTQASLARVAPSVYSPPPPNAPPRWWPRRRRRRRRCAAATAT